MPVLCKNINDSSGHKTENYFQLDALGKLTGKFFNDWIRIRLLKRVIFLLNRMFNY